MRHQSSLAALVLAVGWLLASPAGSLVTAAPRDTGVAEAAMRGDVEAVRTLLRGGADVNAPQGDGMTALHWAALNADLDTMNVLLSAGATVEATTRVGSYTPLHLAALRGHAAVATRLLEAGSRVAAVTSTGVQPLHLAAQSGDTTLLAALLDKGADINARDKTHGRTPLVFAAASDRLDAVSVLLKRGADARITTTVIDYQARAAADSEARKTRDKVLSAQTGRNIDSTFDPDPPPPGTAPDQVSTGRAAPPDPNEPDINGRRRDGPRPPSDIEQIGRQGGFTALHYAARDGFGGVARALLDGGMDLNAPTAGDRSTPMIVAIINGQFDLALDLLGRGADPNLANDDGDGRGHGRQRQECRQPAQEHQACEQREGGEQERGSHGATMHMGSRRAGPDRAATGTSKEMRASNVRSHGSLTCRLRGSLTWTATSVGAGAAGM